MTARMPLSFINHSILSWQLCPCADVNSPIKRNDELTQWGIYINNNFFFNFFFVLSSALLHLPPLRFHCVGGCWERIDKGVGEEPNHMAARKSWSSINQ